MTTAITQRSFEFLRHASPLEYRRRTCDVEVNVEHVVVVVLRRHLAVIDALVLRPHVLYDQAPLVLSLVVVHAKSRVGRERIEADCQWMCIALSTPRYLGVVTQSFHPSISLFCRQVQTTNKHKSTFTGRVEEERRLSVKSTHP